MTVGQNLVAHVPDDVPFEHACYAVVGSIALQGIRLAQVGIGSVVGVIGLGLIGQFAVMLLKAAGCTVLGNDLETSSVGWPAPWGPIGLDRRDSRRRWRPTLAATGRMLS